jgi:hypothetical protein
MDDLAVILALAYLAWELYEVVVCLRRGGLKSLSQAGTRP